MVLFAGCGDLRVKMGIYANLDEARKAGAIASGWVPEGLAAGTSDLREGHLPDGRHWGAFTFPSADERAGARAARIGDHDRHARVRAARPARVLAARAASPVDVERVRSTGFRLYRGRDRAPTRSTGVRAGPTTGAAEPRTC